MAGFGEGYDSDCHLLCCLGRYRERPNTLVCAAIGADALRWLDFPFQSVWPNEKALAQLPDAEWLSLDFLRQDSAIA